MILSTDEARALLVQAKSGNCPKAAEQLMAHFVSCLTDGARFDRGILDDYILHAFERILGCNGADPLSAEQALGLKAKAGRPQTTEERDIQIASCVEYLVRFKAHTWENACAVAAGHFLGTESRERTAQQAHKKYLEILRMGCDPTAEFLLSGLPEELRQKI